MGTPSYWLCLFDIRLWSWSMCLLSATIRCFRLNLYFSHLGPKISYICKEPGSFWWNMIFRNQDLRSMGLIAAGVSWLPDLFSEWIRNSIFLKAWVHTDMFNSNPVTYAFLHLPHSISISPPPQVKPCPQQHQMFPHLFYSSINTQKIVSELYHQRLYQQKTYCINFNMFLLFFLSLENVI